MGMNNPVDIKQWADRYVAQWNEPDPDARAKLIRELWASDGLQVLVDPPQEVREALGGWRSRCHRWRSGVTRP
jgi:hypothetical protein